MTDQMDQTDPIVFPKLSTYLSWSFLEPAPLPASHILTGFEPMDTISALDTFEEPPAKRSCSINPFTLPDQVETFEFHRGCSCRLHKERCELCDAAGHFTDKCGDYQVFQPPETPARPPTPVDPPAIPPPNPLTSASASRNDLKRARSLAASRGEVFAPEQIEPIPVSIIRPLLPPFSSNPMLTALLFDEPQPELPRMPFFGQRTG